MDTETSSRRKRSRSPPPVDPSTPSVQPIPKRQKHGGGGVLTLPTPSPTPNRQNTSAENLAVCTPPPFVTLPPLQEVIEQTAHGSMEHTSSEDTIMVDGDRDPVTAESFPEAIKSNSVSFVQFEERVGAPQVTTIKTMGLETDVKLNAEKTSAASAGEYLESHPRVAAEAIHAIENEQVQGVVSVQVNLMSGTSVPFFETSRRLVEPVRGESLTNVRMEGDDAERYVQPHPTGTESGTESHGPLQVQPGPTRGDSSTSVRGNENDAERDSNLQTIGSGNKSLGPLQVNAEPPPIEPEPFSPESPLIFQTGKQEYPLSDQTTLLAPITSETVAFSEVTSQTIAEKLVQEYYKIKTSTETRPGDDLERFTKATPPLAVPHNIEPDIQLRDHTSSNGTGSPAGAIGSVLSELIPTPLTFSQDEDAPLMMSHSPGSLETQPFDPFDLGVVQAITNRDLVHTETITPFLHEALPGTTLVRPITFTPDMPASSIIEVDQKLVSPPTPSIILHGFNQASMNPSDGISSGGAGLESVDTVLDIHHLPLTFTPDHGEDSRLNALPALGRSRSMSLFETPLVSPLTFGEDTEAGSAPPSPNDYLGSVPPPTNLVVPMMLEEMTPVLVIMNINDESRESGMDPVTIQPTPTPPFEPPIMPLTDDADQVMESPTLATLGLLEVPFAVPLIFDVDTEMNGTNSTPVTTVPALFRDTLMVIEDTEGEMLSMSSLLVPSFLAAIVAPMELGSPESTGADLGDQLLASAMASIGDEAVSRLPLDFELVDQAEDRSHNTASYISTIAPAVSKPVTPALTIEEPVDVNMSPSTSTKDADQSMAELRTSLVPPVILKLSGDEVYVFPSTGAEIEDHPMSDLLPPVVAPVTFKTPPLTGIEFVDRIHASSAATTGLGLYIPLVAPVTFKPDTPTPITVTLLPAAMAENVDHPMSDFHAPAVAPITFTLDTLSPTAMEFVNQSQLSLAAPLSLDTSTISVMELVNSASAARTVFDSSTALVAPITLKPDTPTPITVTLLPAAVVENVDHPMSDFHAPAVAPVTFALDTLSPAAMGFVGRSHASLAAPLSLDTPTISVMELVIPVSAARTVFDLSTPLVAPVTFRLDSPALITVESLPTAMAENVDHPMSDFHAPAVAPVTFALDTLSPAAMGFVGRSHASLAAPLSLDTPTISVMELVIPVSAARTVFDLSTPLVAPVTFRLDSPALITVESLPTAMAENVDHPMSDFHAPAVAPVTFALDTLSPAAMGFVGRSHASLAAPLSLDTPTISVMELVNPVSAARTVFDLSTPLVAPVTFRLDSPALITVESLPTAMAENVDQPMSNLLVTPLILEPDTRAPTAMEVVDPVYVSADASVSTPMVGPVSIRPGAPIIVKLGDPLHLPAAIAEHIDQPMSDSAIAPITFELDILSTAAMEFVDQSHASPLSLGKLLNFENLASTARTVSDLFTPLVAPVVFKPDTPALIPVELVDQMFAFPVLGKNEDQPMSGLLAPVVTPVTFKPDTPSPPTLEFVDQSHVSLVEAMDQVHMSLALKIKDKDQGLSRVESVGHASSARIEDEDQAIRDLHVPVLEPTAFRSDTPVPMVEELIGYSGMLPAEDLNPKPIHGRMAASDQAETGGQQFLDHLFAPLTFTPPKELLNIGRADNKSDLAVASRGGHTNSMTEKMNAQLLHKAKHSPDLSTFAAVPEPKISRSRQHIDNAVLMDTIAFAALISPLVFSDPLPPSHSPTFNAPSLLPTQANSHSNKRTKSRPSKITMRPLVYDADSDTDAATSPGSDSRSSIDNDTEDEHMDSQFYDIEATAAEDYHSPLVSPATSEDEHGERSESDHPSVSYQRGYEDTGNDAHTSDNGGNGDMFDDPLLESYFREMLNSLPDNPVTRKDLAVLAQLFAKSYSPPKQRSASPVGKIYGKRHRPPTKVTLSRDVREHAFFLMKRVKILGQKVHAIKSATPEQVERFARTGNTKFGPNLSDFLLDLSGKGVASLWNKRAAVLFSYDFLKSKKYEHRDEESIKAAFTTHIIQLKNQYKSYLNLEEAGNPALKARPARRRSRRERRSEICEIFSADSRMREFGKIWEGIPWYGCSGDETDSRLVPHRHIITTLPWRAPEIRTWMQTFDNLHLNTRFVSGLRATPGNFPYVRVEPTRQDLRNERGMAEVVVGLPRNFYHQDWLDNLDKHQLRALRMAPPIDLSFPANMLRIAMASRNATSHKAPPFPTEGPILIHGLRKK